MSLLPTSILRAFLGEVCPVSFVFVQEDHPGVRGEGWTVVGDGKGYAMPKQQPGSSFQRSPPRRTWDSWFRQEINFRCEAKSG